MPVFALEFNISIGIVYTAKVQDVLRQLESHWELTVPSSVLIHLSLGRTRLQTSHTQLWPSRTLFEDGGPYRDISK
jgi:hypothetical protein